MSDYSRNRRDFNALKTFISGQEFILAQQIIGLTAGNERHDPEHHQACPISGCDSDDDGFYFRKKTGTFHCRKCEFNGNLIDLVIAVQRVDKTEAYDIIADCADFDNGISNTAIVKVVQKNQKNNQHRFQDGTARRTEFVYTDAEGNPCHKIVRIDGIDASTGEPGKTISQWRMVGGRWEKGAPNMQYLYRLPELLQDSIEEVWVVEGEKVADAQWKVLHNAGVTNIAVTTSPGGSQRGKQWDKFVQRYPSILTKRIRVFPDNDEPGVKYALTVSEAILKANPSADVRFVKLPDLPEGGDFVDWYAKFVVHGKDESAAVETLKVYCEHPDYSIPVTPGQCESMAEDIILNPKEPLRSADKFIEKVYSSHGIPTLTRYAEDFWQWRGNIYRKIETGAVSNRLLHFLEQAKVGCKKNEDSDDGDDDTSTLIPFPITPANLNSIEDLLKRRIFQPVSDTTPCWIGGESCKMPSSVADPSQLIFGKSTILNLEDMTTLNPSPHWFNIAALDFDYDPTALCPQWNAFLDSVFDDDEQSKKTLMEWMGLCLTSITKFQKAMFLVGKKRSGKGTIARILQKIVGHHNVTAQSTSDFAQTFGFESFLGKTLAVVSDARIGRQTYASGFTEKVLNIVGEDTIKINRKYRDALSVRLAAKLMLLSNEVPHIIDQSGALASRFIFIKFPKSFYGKEDIELENKLLRELPGILHLAIEHLQNLLNRGYFIQPETGKELSKRMTALSSPAGEFATKLVPYMTQDEIWEKWKACCDIEKQHYGTKTALWNNLESAGYNCDFEMAKILAKIKNSGGVAETRDFRDCSRRFHDEPETLESKLEEAVKLGVLQFRSETRGNNKEVRIYSEPAPCKNDDAAQNCDTEPTPSVSDDDSKQSCDVDPDIF